MVIPALPAAVGGPAREGRATPVTPDDRIVCFGDSITRLGFCPDVPDCSVGEGWVTLLRRDLSDAAGMVPEFVNAGVGGDTVMDLSARVEAEVVARCPTVVILMVGLNDTWRFARDPALVPAGAPDHVPARQYGPALARLVRIILDGPSHPRLLLATPPLLGEDPAEAEGPRADALNRRLEEYCKAMRWVAIEAGVGWADIRSAFLDYERAHNRAGVRYGLLTLPDGVHLNGAGQRFLADRMRRALTSSGG